MKNYYVTAGAVILVLALIFIFTGRKSEAPVQVENVNLLEESQFITGEYVLNAEESVIYWEGEFVTGRKEQGTVKLEAGTLVVSNNSIESGEFIIDMNSIDSEPRIERLVNHLKSDDFFSVSTFPTAKFVLKTFEPTTSEGASIGRYVISGDLTVKGITKPISMVATVFEENDTLIARASFAINRTEWDIRYNSASFFSNLGDSVIRDSVIIGLDLKAQKVIE